MKNPIEHACMMKLNQEFIFIYAQKPKGFCDSAWESIYPFLKELANGGGNFYDGWMKVVHISRKWSIVSFLA